MRSLLGLVLAAVALGSPALLLHAPPPHGSPRSPPEPRLPRPQVAARWSRGSLASLTLLRRLTAREARHAQVALAGCERRAAARHGAHRLVSYRRCAMSVLQRAQAYASTNSRLLAQLAVNEAPSSACRGRVLGLSGSAGQLAMIARATVSGTYGVPWSDVLDASRSVRGLARDAGREASDASWTGICRPLPSLPAPPTGPVA